MLAKDLKKGDIFTVNGHTDPEGPARECLSAHGAGKGIRFGFPGNDQYWCFMGKNVEVTLVGPKSTTNIPQIERLASIQVSNVVEVGIVDLPSKCLHCGADIEEVGLVEWNWKDVGYAGKILAGEFETDGDDFDGDSFHPSEYRCAQCHSVLNDYRRDNVGKQTRENLEQNIFEAAVKIGYNSSFGDQESCYLTKALSAALGLLNKEALVKFVQDPTVKELLEDCDDDFKKILRDLGFGDEK